MRKPVYQDRDECAARLISCWRDACSFGYDQAALLRGFQRVYDSTQYKRLPRYQREYVRGFERCYAVNVIDRMYLEHGNWVNMPDGSVRWFGLPERVNSQLVYDVEIDYKYMSEHSIPERTGIYWVADPKLGREAGTMPYFVGEK